MATIINNVRWADNTEELKRNLLDGIGTIDAMKSSVDRTAQSLGGSGLFGAANKLVAAIEQLGGVTKLTAAEQDRANATLDKAIEKYTAMGMTAPAAMQELSDKLKGSSAAMDEQNQVQEVLFGQLAAGVSVGVLAAGAIGKLGDAAHAVVGFLEESVQAAASYENAQARLVGAITATGQARDVALPALQELAEQIASTTTVSKTSALEMEARFIQLGGVTAQGMAQATQAALDLSAGLRIDLDSAVTMISKALEGHVTGLQRYGIVLDEARVKAEGAAYIFDALNERFGGQAAAQAQTYAGQVQRLGNAWEEYKISVGGAITSDAVLQLGLEKLNDGIEEGNKSTTSLGERTLSWTTTLIEAVPVIGDLARYVHAAHDALEDLAAAQLTVERATNQVESAWKRYVATLNQNQAHPIVSGLTDNQAAVNARQEAERNQAAMTAGLADWQKQRIAADTQAGLSAKDAAADVQANIVVVQQYIETLKTSTAETLKHAQATAQETDVLTGNVAANKDTVAALMAVIPGLAIGSDTYNRVAAAIQNMLDKGQVVPDVLKNWYDANKPVLTSTQTQLAYMDAMNLVIPDLSNRTKEFENQQDGLSKSGDLVGVTYQDLTLKLQHVGQEVLPETKKAIDQARASMHSWQDEIGGLVSALGFLAQSADGAFGNIVRDVANGLAAFQNARNSVHDFQTSSANDDSMGMLSSGVGMAGSFMQATKGGQGAVMGTIGGAATGNEVGGGIGSIFGPAGAAIGAVLGTVVGGVVGLIRNIGGPSQQEVAGRQTEGDFEQQMGGWQGVQKALVDAGLSADETNAHLQALWAAEKQGPAAVQAQIDSINHVIDQAKLAATGVDTILSAAKDVGGSVPAALKPTLETLTTMKGLTSDEQTSLKALLSGGQTDFAGLTQMASGYGITLEQLGPSFEKANITSRSQQIYQDFTKLTSAGADTNGVLAGMAKSISGVVDDAMQFATAVPDAMKPMIQKLIDAGELTDASGKKITDMTGITFDGTPLDDGMQGLTKAINDLITTLGGVPQKITDIANTSVPAIDIPVRYDTSAADASFAARGGLVTASGVQYFAVGGNVLAGPWGSQGTDTVPAMLTPGEQVLSVDQARAYRAGTAAGGDSLSADHLEELRGIRAEQRRQYRYMRTIFPKQLRQAIR